MIKRNVTITLEKAIEWYNSDDESLKDLALQAFTKEELIHNFRDITNFKKACDALDYNYDDIVSKVNSIAELSRASAAMFKLDIVRKALNAGYDMHIRRNVDGQKYSHYPFFALVIKGSTCYRGAKEIDKYKKLVNLQVKELSMKSLMQAFILILIIKVCVTITLIVDILLLVLIMDS